MATRSRNLRLFTNYGTDHWPTVSTIGAADGEVFIFDSLYQSVSDNVKNQIVATPRTSIRLYFASVQKRLGGYDCGLFAIALALGNNPGSVTFHKIEMRFTSTSVYPNGELTMSQASSSKNAVIASHDTIDIHCVCRKPEIRGIYKYGGMYQLL